MHFRTTGWSSVFLLKSKTCLVSFNGKIKHNRIVIGLQTVSNLGALILYFHHVSLKAGLGSITSVAGNAQVGCWLNLSSSGLRKWEKLNRVITHSKDGREDVPRH